MQLPKPLAPMAAHKQFILWTTRDGRKLPISPLTGEVIDAHDVTHWTDAVTAGSVADAMPGHGVAFVITEAAGIWFLDIDKAYDGQQWSPLAQELCNRLAGCAVEISQSGTGLHIFGTGPVPAHGCKNIGLGIELYTDKRFVALTGNGATGDAAFRADDAIAAVAATYFPFGGDGQTMGEVNWQDAAREDWRGPDDDNELITLMMSARQSPAQVLGIRATFEDLFMCNVEKLAECYPPNDPEKDQFDRSSADAALAQHLAYWTGCNTERMSRLMRMSGLVRDKWDRNKSYMWRTISKSAGRQDKVYQAREAMDAPPVPVVATAQVALPEDLKPTVRAGVQFMTAAQQVDYFANCVYLADSHRVMTPIGILKPDSFKAMYGGYEFALDNENSKTSFNPWDVFTLSRAVDFPKVEGACFRPEAGEMNLVNDEGRRLLNVYRAANVELADGDATPFLTHIAKLLPDERDQQILLGYMATVVQNPGIKAQWWPVLQGGEGNGKTLIARVFERAVGMVYSHTPKADQLAESGMKFNGWLENKLLLVIEEIRVGDRIELLDAMKDMVTNERIEVQAKGRDQVVTDNRANGIMFTNHKDAIPHNVDGRRYAIMYTAQQGKSALVRDGMDGSYFPDLYNWLRAGGFAICAKWLREYKPAQWVTDCIMTRAPETSSNDEVRAATLSPIEQEINEAIESGRQGFKGGWVSGTQLDRYMSERGISRRVSHKRRTEILERMGYVPHPNLPGGRVNNPLPTEGGTRPRLFVKAESLLCQLEDCSAIVDRYMKDQGMMVTMIGAA